MTDRAVYIILTVLAELPVYDDIGCDVFVALHTLLSVNIATED